MQDSVFEKDVEQYLEYRHQSRTFHGVIEVPFIKHLICNELGVKGRDILDIGCGFGFYAKYFLEQGAKSVECIDKSPAMIELARKYVLSDRANYRVADIDEFIISGRFDIAFASLSLSESKDLEKVYCNVRKSLRRKALFLVSEVHPVATVLKPSGKDEYTTFSKNYFNVTIGMEDYINSAIASGFTLKMYREPGVTEEASQAVGLNKRAKLFPRFFVLIFQKE